MDSIFSIGLAGVHRGMENVSRDAERVMRSFTPDSTEDPVKPILDLKGDQRQVEASTKILQIGDGMLGSILDILG